MILWKPEPDPQNSGHWRIVNVKTGKVVVYGLTARDAKEFADRRNHQEEKRHAKT
jgi:hypothetical protein